MESNALAQLTRIAGRQTTTLTHTAHAALAIFTIGSGMRTRLGCPDFTSVASTRTTSSDMTIGSLTKSKTCPYSFI